ncbi:hypothetical protein SBA2_640002 [Acidobacteriia bacterium SbA2]|nr:hypothetical protein SBA2_640002 [Acidobacteriia bacterium SbA2]
MRLIGAIRQGDGFGHLSVQLDDPIHQPQPLSFNRPDCMRLIECILYRCANTSEHRMRWDMNSLFRRLYREVSASLHD